MDEPKVMICICSGAPKNYALHYMVASLRNLDYPNKEIQWGVTMNLSGRDYEDFYYRLRSLMDTVPWDCKWGINRSIVTMEECKIPYRIIVRNRQLMRNLFLDSDSDYMFLLGGDNPPSRDAIRRLMKLDADVAFGVAYQRPKKDPSNSEGGYHMVWKYVWDMRDIDKRRDVVDRVNYDQFRKAFFNSSMTYPIYPTDDDWKKGVIDYCFGGDGNCLYSRRVLEEVGWVSPDDHLHSEDVNFMNWANLLGFRVKCDLTYHVPHFDDVSGEFM